jgi:hypothetical protein
MIINRSLFPLFMLAPLVARQQGYDGKNRASQHAQRRRRIAAGSPAAQRRAARRNSR